MCGVKNSHPIRNIRRPQPAPAAWLPAQPRGTPEHNPGSPVWGTFPNKPPHPPVARTLSLLQEDLRAPSASAHDVGNGEAIRACHPNRHHVTNHNVKNHHVTYSTLLDPPFWSIVHNNLSLFPPTPIPLSPSPALSKSKGPASSFSDSLSLARARTLSKQRPCLGRVLRPAALIPPVGADDGTPVTANPLAPEYSVPSSP